LKTVCFVDGYNVFYGLLAGTQFKWLDLPKLLSLILNIQNPKSQITAIHYFTAPIKPALASRGTESLHAQNTYIRALKAHGVLVQQGRHQLDRARAPAFTPQEPPSRQAMVDIWKLEEKETDVRIALSVYRTISLIRKTEPEDTCLQVVLMSADTDFTPLLAAVKEDFEDVRLGLILPHRENSTRPAPGAMLKYSDWTRRQISDIELASCQFPSRVATHKKPATKPEYW
jgi:uncharacterized LabA/DUF88 family protein